MVNGALALAGLRIEVGLLWVSSAWIAFVTATNEFRALAFAILLVKLKALIRASITKSRWANTAAIRFGIRRADTRDNLG